MLKLCTTLTLTLTSTSPPPTGSDCGSNGKLNWKVCCSFPNAGRWRGGRAGMQPDAGGVDRLGNAFESNIAFAVPFSAWPRTKFEFAARPLTVSTIGPNAAAARANWAKTATGYNYIVAAKLLQFLLLLLLLLRIN